MIELCKSIEKMAKQFNKTKTGMPGWKWFSLSVGFVNIESMKGINKSLWLNNTYIGSIERQSLFPHFLRSDSFWHTRFPANIFPPIFLKHCLSFTPLHLISLLLSLFPYLSSLFQPIKSIADLWGARVAPHPACFTLQEYFHFVFS